MSIRVFIYLKEFINKYNKITKSRHLNSSSFTHKSKATIIKSHGFQVLEIQNWQVLLLSWLVKANLLKSYLNLLLFFWD